MASDERGGQRKPPRVEVLYFPKKPKPAQTGTTHVARTRTKTLTLPEFRPDDDVVTQPHYEPPEERPARATPPIRDRRSKRGPRPKVQGKPSARRRTPPEPFRPIEVDTDPALRYHKEKVDQMLQANAPHESGELSPQRLAELSLYGHRLFESGRLHEARVVFEGLVEMNVRDAFPYTMLGTVYLALGAQDRALALFEAAVELDPNDLAALVYRGEIRLSRGKLKPALDDLNRAISMGLGDDPFVQRAKRLVRLAQDMAQKRR